MKPSQRSHEAVRTLASIAVASSVALVARASFADHYTVPSGSMEPTVHVADRVLVRKCAYGLRVPMTERYLVRFEGPRRGDVVVLESPQTPMVLLKRVVAVGGDRVQVRDGHVEYLDGGGTATAPDARTERLDGRSHALSLDDGAGPDFGPVTVPAGQLLVLGDNRGNSNDGRFFGFVRADAVLGRAEGIFSRGGHLTWSPL